MTASKTPFATAVGLRDAIVRGELSAREACTRTFARIDEVDGDLHAFLHVDRERAFARADALDRASDKTGALHGVPIAIKDNIVVRGMTTTAGSRVLAGYVPPYDATVIARLEHAGAIVVGKTVCDEFAMGSSTEHCAYGPARNPWDRTRTPGGSSGGSAAAVAAEMTSIALGSDTGGSIRQPAAFCGVVGMKPTYGRVSRYGAIALASSLDQIGPFGRTVADAARVLEVIAGADPHDATSADRPVPRFSQGISHDVRGLRVGVPRDLLASGVDAEVMASFERALESLGRMGATIETIALPHSRVAIAVYYLVLTAEASSNLARYDGVRYGARVPAAALDAMYDETRRQGFGAEVKRRIMLGTYVLSAGYYDAYYLKAQQVRTLIRQDFDRAFERVDVVATPTTPTPAFRLGERTEDPLAMYAADVFTVSAPLAGLPAISVPCGRVGALPVGLQFVGRAWDEATLFRAAQAVEDAA